MREITFRVWDTNKKVLIHPPFSIFWNDAPTVVVQLGRGDQPHFLVVGENCELSQSTGLKDKNGKEIWENDIVSGSWSGLEIVKFEGVGIHPFYESDSDGCPHFCESTECEVIGNVYENPELLK